MNKSAALIIILFSIGHIRADFTPRNLYSLVLDAEKIIEGEVICVDDKVFELYVKNSIDFEEKTITVKKFIDWTCGVRWSKYYVGQKLFVFLAHEDGEYYSLGGGNEGEMPIIKQTVYINSISLPHKFDGLVKIYPLTEYAKADRPYYEGYEIGVQDFWDYIHLLRNCFQFEPNKYRRVSRATYLGSRELADTLSKKSRIYKWTLGALIN